MEHMMLSRTERQRTAKSFVPEASVARIAQSKDTLTGSDWRRPCANRESLRRPLYCLTDKYMQGALQFLPALHTTKESSNCV